MAIIGGSKAKYFRFQKQRKRRPELAAYEQRNEQLRMVGWETYADYLASPEWKAIRERKLRKHPPCTACRRADATQVHHWCYEDEVLFGFVPMMLIPLCRACHESIEFDADGNKVSLEKANENLMRITRRCGILRRNIDRAWRQIRDIRASAAKRAKQEGRHDRHQEWTHKQRQKMERKRDEQERIRRAAAFSPVVDVLLSDCFVVPNREPCDRLRAATGHVDASMESVRKVLFGMLRGARVDAVYDRPFGTVRELLARDNGAGRSFRLVLVWGVGRDGRPKVAPDGEKRVVYFAWFGEADERPVSLADPAAVDLTTVSVSVSTSALVVWQQRVAEYGDADEGDVVAALRLARVCPADELPVRPRPDRTGSDDTNRFYATDGRVTFVLAQTPGGVKVVTVLVPSIRPGVVVGKASRRKAAADLDRCVGRLVRVTKELEDCRTARERERLKNRLSGNGC